MLGPVAAWVEAGPLTGWSIRGDKHDYAQWPEGWQWEDNLPFFKKLEDRLGIRSKAPTVLTEKILKAAEMTGFERKNDLNDGSLCGYFGYNTSE